MKIIEYKYHITGKIHEFRWIDETSEKSEKTSDQPLPTFGEALESLKDIVIDACNLKEDTELDILGIKMDPKRGTSCKFNVEVFTEAGSWKFNTRKIYISQLSDADKEHIANFLNESAKFIYGERAS